MSTGEHAPQQPIEVGILGATGMVGQQFIRVAGSASVVQADLARRQRALGGQGLRGGGDVAARDAAT